jgi:hypothetical protein
MEMERRFAVAALCGVGQPLEIAAGCWDGIEQKMN